MLSVWLINEGILDFCLNIAILKTIVKVLNAIIIGFYVGGAVLEKRLERVAEKDVKNKVEFLNYINVGERCHEIFLTKDELPEMSGFGLNMAGIAQLQPPYHIERNNPQEHSILITQSGEGFLEWEQGEKVIEANSMVVLPAGASFRFTIKGEHWHLCWLLLHDKHDLLKQKTFSKRVYPCFDAENIEHHQHVAEFEVKVCSRGGNIVD